MARVLEGFSWIGQGLKSPIVTKYLNYPSVYLRITQGIFRYSPLQIFHWDSSIAILLLHPFLQPGLSSRVFHRYTTGTFFHNHNHNRYRYKLYKTYMVLQDTAVLLVPITKREATVQNLIHDLLNYNMKTIYSALRSGPVQYFTLLKGGPRTGLVILF